MLINSANLDALRVGFSTAFQGGLGMVTPMWERIATPVPSTTKEQKYGWLGKVPGMREWLGPRVVQNLQQHDYAIINKTFETTIGVERDDIDDDNLGIYTPMFQALGEATGAQYDLLIWALLAAGFASECYDGQYFFDTDHPVLDESGTPQSVSNTGGGSGTAWFLLCTNKVLKPLILQKRKAWQFVAKDDPRDDRVFMNKEFVYGVDGRCNVGYGFWQFAYGSKQTLDGAAYGVARAALTEMKGDYGRPLGLMPNLLVVPGSLESAGRKILNSEYGTGGITNEWKGTAEPLLVPWLA